MNINPEGVAQSEKMIREPDADTTIDEIHRTRERLAKQFGGDIQAILAYARRRQAESGRPIWRGTSANKAVNRSGESGGN